MLLEENFPFNTIGGNAFNHQSDIYFLSNPLVSVRLCYENWKIPNFSQVRITSTNTSYY